MGRARTGSLQFQSAFEVLEVVGAGVVASGKCHFHISPPIWSGNSQVGGDCETSASRACANPAIASGLLTPWSQMMQEERKRERGGGGEGVNHRNEPKVQKVYLAMKGKHQFRTEGKMVHARGDARAYTSVCVQRTCSALLFLAVFAAPS